MANRRNLRGVRRERQRVHLGSRQSHSDETEAERCENAKESASHATVGDEAGGDGREEEQ